MSSKESLKFVPQTPVRLVDSRGCWTDPVTLVERCGKRNAAGSIMRITAPAGASVAVVNLTAIDPQAAGYVSADACSNMTAGPQPQSNLNAIVGAVVANMAMVPVADDGTFCVYVSTSMHVAVDVMGTFASTGQLDYVPVTPLRVHDSRQPK